MAILDRRCPEGCCVFGPKKADARWSSLWPPKAVGPAMLETKCRRALLLPSFLPNDESRNFRPILRHLIYQIYLPKIIFERKSVLNC